MISVDLMFCLRFQLDEKRRSQQRKEKRGKVKAKRVALLRPTRRRRWRRARRSHPARHTLCDSDQPSGTQPLQMRSASPVSHAAEGQGLVCRGHPKHQIPNPQTPQIEKKNVTFFFLIGNNLATT